MSQKPIILQALRDAGERGITNGELNRLGVFRYSARIHELRADGHVIRTVNGSHGKATFYLEASPTPAAPITPQAQPEAALFDAPVPPHWKDAA